jgi:hypothetical protein
VPAAVTENVTLPPRPTDWPAGWAEMVGAGVAEPPPPEEPPGVSEAVKSWVLLLPTSQRPLAKKAKLWLAKSLRNLQR